jgi:membrane-associated phospholipid phosphatase
LMDLGRTASDWGELHKAPLVLLIVIALVGYFLRRPQLYWSALAGILSGVVAGILVNLVKWFAGRPRPSTTIPDGFYPFHTGWDYASFPSGHATHTIAIVAAVAVLAPRTANALFFGALLVIWSRWYLERHYPTDLWVGACLGLGIGLLFGCATRNVYLRHVKALTATSTLAEKESLPS